MSHTLAAGRRSLAGITWHKPLLVLAALMAVTALVSVVGLVADPRQLVGAPAWAKPLKFSISFVLYGATLVWMISLVASQGTFLSYGTTARSARRHGAGDRNGAVGEGVQATWLAIGAGLAILAVNRWILILSGALGALGALLTLNGFLLLV